MPSAGALDLVSRIDSFILGSLGTCQCKYREKQRIHLNLHRFYSIDRPPISVQVGLVLRLGRVEAYPNWQNLESPLDP